ncbi:MAG: glutathione peroxidase [Dialister pneumosintes]
MSIYEYKAKNLSGQEVSMSHYKGQVMLIFNSATHCGFTPQYDDIQRLFDKYHKQGLSVLEFPCNQFGNQAPEDDQEIEQICKVRFGVNYDRFKKVDVNGSNALPLFDYLKSQQGFKGFGTNKKVSDKFKSFAVKAMLAIKNPDYKNSNDIKWNFTKFIVDRQGNVVARFEPTQDMNEVETCIKELLTQ